MEQVEAEYKENPLPLRQQATPSRIPFFHWTHFSPSLLLAQGSPWFHPIHSTYQTWDKGNILDFIP